MVEIIHAQLLRNPPVKRNTLPGYEMLVWHNGERVDKYHRLAGGRGRVWNAMAAQLVADCTLAYTEGFELTLFVPRYEQDGIATEQWLRVTSGLSKAPPSLGYINPRAIEVEARSVTLHGGQELPSGWIYTVRDGPGPGDVTMTACGVPDRLPIIIPRMQLALLMLDKDIRATALPEGVS